MEGAPRITQNTNMMDQGGLEGGERDTGGEGEEEQTRRTSRMRRTGRIREGEKERKKEHKELSDLNIRNTLF